MSGSWGALIITPATPASARRTTQRGLRRLTEIALSRATIDTPRGTMTAMVSRFLQVGKAVSYAPERLNVTGSERTIPVDGVV